jgi:uncharacterized phiE125 gp8 family phage protein
MNAIALTGPAVEPVGLDEMRAFLRLDDAAQDDLVGSLTKAARHCVEAASGRVLIAQKWRLALDRWPEDRVVSLPLSPLIAIEAIRVFNAAGVAETLAPALYGVDAVADSPRVLIDEIAPAPKRPLHGIELDLSVGYGSTADAVPAPLRQAVRMLAARWFEHRGDEPNVQLPSDLLAVIAPFRRPRL